MPRYQFRFPKEKKLDDVLNSIVEKAWSAIQPGFDLRRLQSEDFDDFRSGIKRGLKPYVCAFDLCGTAVECSDEIEGAPFMDQEERIYHFIVPESFSELVSGLSFDAFFSIKHLARRGEEESMRVALEHALRHGLNENLFYNPICGRIDLCNESKGIDPWKEQ